MSQTQPVAILFADVSGSTRLFELRGDLEARRLIAAVLTALTEVCERHGGRVIKTIGDEVMCTFPAPFNGILAACDMQRRMTQDADFVADSLGVRIGLHHGEALLEDGDVYGDAVNVAARMASLAKRAQIVTTASTAKAMSNVTARGLGHARVNGKMLPIEIVDIVWQDDASGLTAVQRTLTQGADALETGARLILRYRGEQIELSEDSPPLLLGREAGNDLVIEADWVSRSHASIEFKRGHFVLCDRSTNGTWVRLGEDDELRLHRDELHLRRSGTISLGQALAVNAADVVHFQCA